MRVSALACVLAMVSGVVVFAGRQAPRTDPTLADVLQRAAAYVAEFQVRLSSIGAVEAYVQDWHSVGPKGTTFGRRDRRSELVLMKPPTAQSWAEFRDVFDIDGRVIRSHDGGLEHVLREPALASLRFLEAGNQPRFRFERSVGTGPTPSASASDPADHVFRVSTEVWGIAYDEVRAGTLIRTARRRDLPAHGRFWIEPATGRVLVSELVLDDRTVRATIDVGFQAEPLLDMLVPIAVRERCEHAKTGSIVEGRATYGRFRRLEP